MTAPEPTRERVAQADEVEGAARCPHVLYGGDNAGRCILPDELEAHRWRDRGASSRDGLLYHRDDGVLIEPVDDSALSRWA